MTHYTCSMHPEIIKNKPGKCPKCGGMDLVEVAVKKQSKAGTLLTKYRPIIVVISIILLVSFVVSYQYKRDVASTPAGSSSSLHSGHVSKRIISKKGSQKAVLVAHSPLHVFMQTFMAGYFLVFAAFKLFDLKGFAEGYSGYDLIAGRFKIYGYLFPFIELSIGLAYLTGFRPLITNTFTFIVLFISGLGVLNKLSSKRPFQCACLGTSIQLPLGKVTVAEDFGMAAMAFAMLILYRS